MQGTDWAPGVAVLLGGLGAGAGLAWRAVRGGGRPLSAGPTRRELLDRQQALLAQLRELAPGESEAAAADRARVELEAARVLRELEGLDARRAGGAALPAASRDEVRRKKVKKHKKRESSSWRSTLMGAWAGATVMLLFFLVREGLTPKAPEMPMMPPQGAMGMQVGPMQGGANPTLASGGAPDVRGTISLDPSLKTVQPGATVFVIVRPAGAKRGPPVMAKKLTAASFPLSFTLGAEDSMMGSPFPDTALVEARVDLDGNAMTRDPSEPTAVVDAVAKGSELKLVLKPQQANTN